MMISITPWMMLLIDDGKAELAGVDIDCKVCTLIATLTGDRYAEITWCNDS